MWVVTFDALPDGLKVINCLRNKIKLVSANEEEAEFDHTVENLFTLQEKKKKQKNPAEESSAAFCSMGDETISSSTTFCHEYGKGKEDFVKWTILPDSEQITEDPMPPPDEPKFTEMMDDVPWSADAKEMDYNDTFFKVFFPSIEGHGEILNKWAHHADNAKWKTTVENSNINFHTPDHPLGPDWKIRLCYTLMIAACSSVETGIEDLFKRGESDTWIPYPDFGQWIDRTEFQVFMAGAAYCWCPEAEWFKEKGTEYWTTFLPCLKDFNDKRRKMLKCVLLMLDESMSGWRPKTSKLGGLPNFTMEPRKPVPIGTMFRNGVECITGIFMYQDVVMAPDHQLEKKYAKAVSSLPRKPQLSTHTAEVLRQVENAGVEEGGWVGGDAWFGSVMTLVEVKKRFGVYSTWIIKNNSKFLSSEGTPSNSASKT